MSTLAVNQPLSIPQETQRVPALLRYAVPVGRLLFAAIFISAGLNHFSAASIAYAAAQGVPLANIAVPLSGVIALVGGLMVLLGLYARLGAALLIAFLVPVTLMMHPFWSQTDPMAAQLHTAMFFKNLALIGGALLIAYFGAGPLSVDARRRPADPIAKS